jgi:hypothetical protein
MVIERRKDGKSRATITQILEKMQAVADEKYIGDLQNNTLAIFSTLSTDEKRTFLRRSLMLQWEKQIELATAGLHEVEIEKDVRIDPVAVQTERKSIEDFNYEEQLKLKTWMHKAIFVIGVSCFAVVILLTFFVGKDGVDVEGMIGQLNGVLKLITG